MMTWVSLWYSPGGKRTELEILSHVMAMIEAVVHGHTDPEIESEQKQIGGLT
jgi:hypothetical protein